MARNKTTFKPMKIHHCGYPPLELPTEPGAYYALWPENGSGWRRWQHYTESTDTVSADRNAVARRWRNFRHTLKHCWCGDGRYVEMWSDGDYEFYVIVPKKEAGK